MGRLTEDAKRVLAQMKVVPVATASKDGLPNVVPMSFVKTLGDSAVLIADNFMDKGAGNLEENPMSPSAHGIWRASERIRSKAR